MSGIKCKRCKSNVEPLDVFPGNRCKACYAASVDGRRMPTAEEIVSAWSGKAVR